MIIPRMIDSFVASQKQASHEGKKILLLQPFCLDDQPLGDVVVALDAVDAGVGDRVLAVQEGFSAMTSVGHTDSPIDAAGFGVVGLGEVERSPPPEENQGKKIQPALLSMLLVWA